MPHSFHYATLSPLCSSQLLTASRHGVPGGTEGQGERMLQGDLNEGKPPQLHGEKPEPMRRFYIQLMECLYHVWRLLF